MSHFKKAPEVNQRWIKFPKIYEPLQEGSRGEQAFQKSKNHLKILRDRSTHARSLPRTTNIRNHCTKFYCLCNLAPGIKAPLYYTDSVCDLRRGQQSLHPQSFYIIRLPELLTDLCNSHNSDLYSDLDTGPDHQWMVINVYKKEQNLFFFSTVQSWRGNYQRENRKYVGLSEQQDVVQNERRDAELMTREETGRARSVGDEGHVKETLRNILWK